MQYLVKKGSIEFKQYNDLDATLTWNDNCKNIIIIDERTDINFKEV